MSFIWSAPFKAQNMKTLYVAVLLENAYSFISGWALPKTRHYSRCLMLMIKHASQKKTQAQCFIKYVYFVLSDDITSLYAYLVFKQHQQQVSQN